MAGALQAARLGALLEAMPRSGDNQLDNSALYSAIYAPLP